MATEGKIVEIHGEGGSGASPQADVAQDNINTVLLSFTQMLEEFIGQLHTVFPECPKVAALKQAFETHFSESNTPEERKQYAINYIVGWHDDFTNVYSQVTSEDESVLRDATISFFHTIDLLPKWSSRLHVDTKSSIWEYLKNLCNLSSMYNIYNQVPTNMMSTIQSKAMAIAQSLEDGGSLQNINIQELAVDIMKNVDMNELQQFANTITNGGTDINKIQVMCGSLMNMIGSQGIDMRNIFQLNQ